MTIEDERAAVTFSVTLSSQLIAASMAILAVEGAFVWYALGSRVTRGGFVIGAALTAILIAVSIVQAGKGITKARNAGFKGSWDLGAGKKEFNAQAICLLAALMALAVTFSLAGRSRDTVLQGVVKELRAETAAAREDMQMQVARLAVENKALSTEVGRLSVEVAKLRKSARRRG